MTTRTRIAVLGLGEQGLALSAALQSAGATVLGFDVRPPKSAPVPLAASIAEAVVDADAVVSIASATVATRVAEQAAPHLGPATLFVDANLATPSLKQSIAKVVGADRSVDAAVLQHIENPAATMSLLASGPSAVAFAELMGQLGLVVEVVSADIGAAAARNLIRSMLVKSLEGVVIDYMWAAEAMGVSDWAYTELLQQFAEMTPESAQQFLRSGTVANMKRREIEMLDVVEMLEGADYHSIYVPPTQLVYNRIYHSIRVPYGSEAEQNAHGTQGSPRSTDW